MVLIHIIESTLRVSTPLLFAALGGVVSERSGVINIALEGIMLLGAFVAAAFAFEMGSPYLGVMGGMLAGMSCGAFYAFCVIELQIDQIIAGTAINLLSFGLTPFLSKIFYNTTNSTPSLPLEMRFYQAPILVAWICVAAIAFWLNHTPSGLWVRFAGEHPKALDSAGINVRKTRWMAVLLSGCLAGLGGASLSLFLSSSFSRGMTAGRGFMALAALVFGKWRPWSTAFACVLFGFFDAIQIRLQGVILFGTEPVAVQFIQILPYVVTMFVLAGFVGSSRAPKALGIPLNSR